MTTPSDHRPPTAPDTAAPPTDLDRRAALEKLGTLAVLTPPTVLTLLLSKRASASSVPPFGPPDDPTG